MAFDSWRARHPGAVCATTFACFIIDHSDIGPAEFLNKATEFFSEFLSPWGPSESLAFASNLGAGAGISVALHGRCLEEDCGKMLATLQKNFTADEPVRRPLVTGDDDRRGGYYILGGFGTPDRCGVTSATSKYTPAIKDLNSWLRTWLPGQTWTSLCINQNEKIALHADQGNLPGSLNHSISLGDFTKGALWIEDPSGDEARTFDDVAGRLRGRCVDTHGQLFSFDARTRHCVEEWSGTRWSVTAYTCRRLEDFAKADLKILLELGFPLPEFTPSRLLETYKGIPIVEYHKGWDAADGGIYVGRGSPELTRSVFQEGICSAFEPGAAQLALAGRPLYVLSSEVDSARRVVDDWNLTPGRCWNMDTWRTWLRFWLVDGVTMAFIGLVLKLGLGARPGHLGNFIRCLLCCARKQFKANPVELLPVALPKESAELLSVQEEMLQMWERRRFTRESLQSLKQKVTPEVGAECWTYLQVALLDYMYCGGRQMLGQVMPHPDTWSTAQKEAVERLHKYSRLLTEDSGAKVAIEKWEVVRQSLGDIYFGREVEKAYRLSWRAIEPHVPGPGEAGRVELASVVSPELRDFVENPDLLRIPDGDVPEPRYEAPVLVESDREYDLIVSNLVKSGMLEREVEAETLRINDHPVYNGLFGVHKGWKEDDHGQWFRTLRLIVNLIPSNKCQGRLPVQASKKMGYSPMWGRMTLLEDEVVMCYAEDLRHCFHVFSPGRKWRGYFVLNKRASGACFGDGLPDHARPRVKSAPMGWTNIVDFIQDGLERMGSLAGVPSERIIKMGEPSPLAELTTPRSFFSFYVDNYDQFTIVAQSEVGTYAGRPSDEQLSLREVFKVWNIGRDPKKAAEGVLSWSSLGAEQLGSEGLVGSMRKLRSGILGSTLCLLQAGGVRCGSPELQSLVGKFMHSAQFCRPLASLFDSLYHHLSQKPASHLCGEEALEELLLLSMSLPMHWLDQRMKTSPTVYATDASPDGGGACASLELSSRGRAKCQNLLTMDDLGGRSDEILVVEFFGGVGGLRRSLELLGVVPQGIIFVDNNPLCVKLAKRHCAYVIPVDDINKITEEMVRDWRRQFPRAKRVIAGGGWPCVNHSMLNSSREGASAESSQLLDVMLQVVKWLRKCSKPLRLPDWEVIEIYENVVMDEADLDVQSRKIGFYPSFVEAGDILWCRRPRLWWLRGLPLLPGCDLTIGSKVEKSASAHHETLSKVQHVKLTCEKPALATVLDSGCRKLVDDAEPFFTFTRPQSRSSPPPDPAGMSTCSQKVLGRWKGDSYRLAPYQYQDANMVRSSTGVRRLNSKEQLRMMGFSNRHLELKQKLTEDQRQQLIGNSWPVPVVARLLAALVLDANEVGTRNLCEELLAVAAADEAKTARLQSTSWQERFGPEACDLPMAVSLRARGRTQSQAVTGFIPGRRKVS